MTKIAVVGAGLIGERHVDRVAAQAELAAVVDPNPAACALADRFSAPWFADFGAYISEHKPDGVILATPNRLHVAQGLACVEAGIPMLIEKPISDRAADAAELVAAAEAAEVAILVGHHRRHNPLIATAKQAIEAGKLGALTMIDAQFWLYKPDDYYQLAWRSQPGGGPIYINLIHDIDLLRHLCGDIVSVQARESSQQRGFAVENSAVLLLEFASGALGTVSVSDCTVAPWSWELTAQENPAYHPTGQDAYRIAGTEGALSVPDLKLWQHPGPRSWWEPLGSKQLDYAPADPLDVQMAHFIDVIAGRAEPLVSGAEGLATLRVVEAIKTAAATGERVALPRPSPS